MTKLYKHNNVYYKFVVLKIIIQLKKMGNLGEMKKQMEIEELKQQITRLQEQNTKLNKQIHGFFKQKSEFLKNESRYKEAQILGKIGNWEFNIQEETFWGSEEAKKMYGFDPEQSDFTSEEVENCIPERHRVHQALIDLIRENKTYDLQFEIITKDKGIRKIIHSIAILELDKTGKPSKVTGIVTDITERKKIESKLSESEELFSILSETTPSAIMIYQNDKWVYANAAASQISGYSRDELMQMHFWEFVHPEFQELVKKMGFRRQNQGNAQKNYEFKIITKQGNVKWVWLNGASTVYKDNPAGIITVDDITDFKQAQIELEESEDRFKFLSEATFEGIVVHNRGIIFDANDSFVKITGLRREEVIGKNLLDYIPKLKDRAKIVMNMAKGKTDPYIVSAKRTDGSRLTVELEAKNITRSGKRLRIAAVRDISKRVEAEKNAEEISKRYRNIFDSAPISIWEEDFSEAYKYIESLKLKGVKDFDKFFKENPQEVAICSQKVKILDVNKTTLSMFRAASKKDFLNNLYSIFTVDSLITFREQLIKIANKEIFYKGMCINKTF